MAISYVLCVYIAYDHLTFAFGGKLGQNLTETLRIQYDNRKIIVPSSYIFTTSLYKLHDALTMTLLKSQGVGTLTVQLSCNFMYEFKRPSMFIFEFHFNCVLKSCGHKSCYEEASIYS